MKESLEAVLEAKYKEYKTYKDYILKLAEDRKESEQNFEKFVVENANDMKKISDKLYELKILPNMCIADLNKIQAELLQTYDVINGLIDVPQEIKKEISSLARRKQYFIIKNGEVEPIDSSYNDKIVNQAKKQYDEHVKKLLNGE